jgi:hypothetical protein
MADNNNDNADGANGAVLVHPDQLRAIMRELMNEHVGQRRQRDEDPRPPPRPQGPQDPARDDHDRRQQADHDRVAAARRTAEFLEMGADDVGDVAAAARTHGRGTLPELEGSASVLAAGMKNFTEKVDPTKRGSIPDEEMMDAKSWGKHLRANYAAMDAIKDGIQANYDECLRGSYGTQHAMMLSIKKLLLVAARYRNVSDDQDFADAANLLIRELEVDKAAKQGMPPEGLSAMRERARLSEMPTAFKEMRAAGYERVKLMKKGN